MSPIVIQTFDVFVWGGGEDMCPALRNQNGIDYGTESPESESIIFSLPESARVFWSS